MKNKSLKATLCLATMLIFVVTASAADRLVVKVPFDFRVGDTYFTSGTYNVALLYGSTVRVTSDDGRGVSYGMSIPNVPVRKTENVLTFNRYGDTYFLSEVSWASMESTRKLLPAAREVELARNETPVRVVRLLAR